MFKTALKSISIVVAAALIFIQSPSALQAGINSEGQISKPSSLDIPKIKSELKIDGILNEETWQQAKKFELPYEISPGENIEAPVKTEVLIMYDETHFYAGFRCYDPEPGQIRARLVDRDSAWNDDRIVLILDTFNDERRAYYFSVNPLGIQMDYAGPHGDEDINWDAIWDSAGVITDWGWSLEVAIPFSIIKMQRIEGDQTWGFSTSRYYPRDQRFWIAINANDRNNDNMLSQLLKIEGFEGIKPGRNLEITPSLVGMNTATPDEYKELFSSGDAEAGVTAKWGLLNNLSLIGTINPDFSQVEADALQLDINEPFALQYPERRPFFSEGSDFLETPLNVIHTRSVRDPDWGAKLVGKEAGYSIGSFAVRDTLTNLILPGSQSSRSISLPMDSTSFVARVNRDLGTRYNLGLIMTNREATDYYNRVFGFDGQLRVTNRDRVSFQVLGSSTLYPSEISRNYDQADESFNDRAIQISYAHNARDLSWWGGYTDIGNGFRADLGFMPQVDYRYYQAGTGYAWYARPGTWWSNVNLNGGFNRYEDQNGNLLREQYNCYLNFSGSMQSSFSPVYNRNKEVYNGVQYDLNTTSLSGGFRPNGNVYIWMGSTFGDRIDYANSRLGSNLRLLSEFVWYAGRHLEINTDATYEKMKVDGGTLFDALLLSGTAVYQFNRKTYIRSTLQYTCYNYETAHYTFDQADYYKRLFMQLLFSYKLNPGTVLFLGYSGSYETDRLLNFGQTNRSLFFKVSYAIQM